MRAATDNEGEEGASDLVPEAPEESAPRIPGTGVTFTKRVCLATAVELSSAHAASARFIRNGILSEIVTGAFLHRWIGDLLSQ